MSSPQLSTTMEEALELAAAGNGTLVRRPGGYWTRPDAQPKGGPYHWGERGPDYANTSTVRALVDRRLMVVAETNKHGDWDRVQIRDIK